MAEHTEIVFRVEFGTKEKDMRTDKHFIRVSRKWDNHVIQHEVIFDQDGVSISADLNEFLTALAKEIGTDIKLGLFTRTVQPEVIQAAMTKALDVVIGDMKNSTA